MTNNERTPIITKDVSLDYTKGKYSFFTQTVAKLVIIVLSILTTAAKLNMVAYFQIVSCIWIVNHNANKLQGISSVSSSVHDNCFCKARQALVNCICAFCYAYNQQSYQTGLKEHNILNGIILRNTLIPVKAFKSLPILFPVLRIESFGDVANVTQARNYIRIIKAFPGKRCAIWSKNKEIWKRAFEIEGKPKNCTYVHSSSELNKPDYIDKEKYTFVDHVFTVYTKAYIKKNNIVINCGGKKCIKCIAEKKNCYFRNTEFYINEQKK